VRVPAAVRRQIGVQGRGEDELADRERGALKRLADIMSRYPALGHYVQGDPRGAPLYILRPEDMPEKLYRQLPDGSMIRDVQPDLSSCYNRGIAVCK
jgi:hypothetical protein